MRRIQNADPYRLWIGHAGDLRNLSRAGEAGVEALVDVACENTIAMAPYSWAYCRFPLSDGSDNPGWMIRAAITTTATLLGQEIPTLVTCGAGMSRSVIIAAVALSIVSGRKVEDCLYDLRLDPASPVSPGLWRDALGVLAGLIENK